MPLFPRKDRKYQVSYDVHTWVGVIVGLLLYTMFFMGAIALVYDPLAHWEEPAHHSVPAASMVDWWEAIPNDGDDVERFSMSFPSTDYETGAPTATVWRDGERTDLVWRDGAWQSKGSHAASFLFNLHYLYHPAASWMMYVAGFVSMGMLLAQLTGLVIHLRDLWTQLDQFRPKLPTRAVWIDLHKVTAVIGLPFQFLFAYTGAILCLGSILLASVAVPLYGGDLDRLMTAFIERPPPIDAEDARAPTLALTSLLDRATAAAPGLVPRFVAVQKPGQTVAEVRVGGARSEHDDQRVNVFLEGATGTVRQVEGLEPPTTSRRVLEWTFGLHFAHFGGSGTLAAYMLLALATCATILSGIAIWLAKQRRATHWSTGVLRGLTTGVGAAVPLASATILLASRVLPWNLDNRTTWLEAVFVVTLGVTGAWSLADRNERRVWGVMLGLTAVVCLAMPLAQATVTPAGLFGASPIEDVVAVDVGFLLCGVGFGLATIAVVRPLRRRPATAEPTHVDAIDTSDVSDATVAHG
ncbi:MAG: PepSY-associated TM helix domain-containing protein [Myxococcota bacterium]